MAACEECQGGGECPIFDCDDGTLPDGDPCEDCSGSGRCADCNGDGEV